MTIWTSFFGRAGLVPYGYCLTWSPALLWSMAGSDAVIACAYFSIPLALVTFVRRRKDPSLHWVAGLFCAFIVSCGMTHLMEIWTIWHPDYGLQSLVKLIAAGTSFLTAAALWPLIPKALATPTVGQLQGVIGALQEEIQKRRSAEDHLLDVEQSLAVALGSIGAGFISADREGRVTGMNAVAERVTGWSTTEAQGRSAWEVFEREDRPQAIRAMNPVEAFIELGYDIDATHHVVAVSRAGVRTPLEVKAGLSRTSDGQARGLVWIFRDVSRLVQAETESNRLAAIVESSDDAIISMTLDGRIRSWNRGAQAMFGYAPDEIIGREVQAIIPPDRATEEMRILAELSVGRRVPPFDTVRLAKGGERIDVSLTISPIRDSRGTLMGGAKIARNITEQRRAETALRASQLRLRFILDAAQVGEWETDLVTGVVIGSLQHDRCFGYESMGPTWNPATYLAHVHPDDRDEVARTTRLRLTTRAEWNYQCRVIWPDATVHWIRVNGTTLFDGVRPVRCVGIIADITRWKQAEEATLRALRLEAENRQIQEASRLKTRFLANMSHELRTPLNAIIGFSDLLYLGAVAHDSPRYKEFLGHIRTSSHHLLQLINDVLDLSKVEAGKLEFAPERISLPVLVKDVGDIMRAAAEKKNITVAVDIDPALPDLVLDPARLKQVLFNYLSNAIKFTPDDGRVTVRARREGGAHVRIEVEDTGIGIATSDLPRLFSEFEQLDQGLDKRHQGTGLGLALTRRLVEAQGGTVGVSSNLGRGSVFYLLINLVHGTDSAAERTV
jgi:PAS domain S-box-containing protein